MICNKCLKDKELEDFYSCTKYTNKTCRECESEKRKERYHNQGGIEAVRKWRAENQALYRAQKAKAQKNKWTRYNNDEAFKEKIKTQSRTNARKNFISGMVQRARVRAVKAGLPFEITVNDIIVPTCCPILGCEFVLGSKGDYKYSPSIDRLDPTKGYTKGNVRIISTLANTMKNSATLEQLIAFSKNIIQYMQDMI